jgi:hypothetical protein
VAGETEGQTISSQVLEPEIRFSCYNAVHKMGAEAAVKTAYDKQLAGSGQTGTGVLNISLK